MGGQEEEEEEENEVKKARFGEKGFQQEGRASMNFLLHARTWHVNSKDLGAKYVLKGRRKGFIF